MAEGACHCSAPPFSLPPRIKVKAELKEIRVCTNRTCRKQGSMQTFETLTALAPPHVAVNTCGCLGRCGTGPNLVALPGGVMIEHCGTAAKAAQVTMELCGVNGPVDKSLEALALRKRAESKFDNGDFEEAEGLLCQAIDLNPFGGIHVLYKNRSWVRLVMGNYSGALEDANEALKLAPQYIEAYICQGDIFLAMDRYDAAENSYSTCLQIDPTIRRSKSFKSRIVKLQEKLTAANVH
ncbi:tetratricopeptide repeat protein 1 isoform X2 [Mangifera indica]|uniref:tetratricopeptide repeat protein 1 isoform X2 n=1 Tax=Mangifera indica TaxID=29780 RepID=UPI001CFBF1ED|nr:tetratricopeptide repeat protein 1 isoform X2 [Mangifera indica]